MTKGLPDRLYNYAVSRPRGFTYVEACHDLDIDRQSFYVAAKKMRWRLGQDEINLVCEPQGCRAPWRYRLVGSYEDARPWAANRLGDAETRCETILSVAVAVSQTTDARTSEGRKARVMVKGVSRVLEDLKEIEEYA